MTRDNYSGRRSKIASAGRTLNDDSAKKKFALTHKAGSVGEKRFTQYAKNLLPGWMVENDHVWVSRDGSPSGGYTSDIDFVFASGNRVLFVDVKMYASKHVYWNLWPLGNYVVRKGVSPMVSKTGEAVAFGNSMLMALNEYRELLPKAHISAITVFVPTGNVRSHQSLPPSTQLPTSVRFLRAPGNVRSYLLPGGLRRIKRHMGRRQEVDEQIRRVLDRNPFRAKPRRRR